MAGAKALVLDANILVRAVLGRRVLSATEPQKLARRRIQLPKKGMPFRRTTVPEIGIRL